MLSLSTSKFTSNVGNHPPSKSSPNSTVKLNYSLTSYSLPDHPLCSIIINQGTLVVLSSWLCPSKIIYLRETKSPSVHQNTINMIHTSRSTTRSSLNIAIDFSKPLYHFFIDTYKVAPNFGPFFRFLHICGFVMNIQTESIKTANILFFVCFKYALHGFFCQGFLHKIWLYISIMFRRTLLKKKNLITDFSGV